MSELIYIEQSTNDVFLSKPYLRSLGVSVKTIECWLNKGNVLRTLKDGELFYLFDTLPLRTKKKLPSKSELRQLQQKQVKENHLQDVAEGIRRAFHFEFNQYIDNYYQFGGNILYEKAVEFAKLHSVLTYIIAEKKEGGCRDLMGLYNTFNNFFPKKYKSKHALSNAIRAAAANGIQSIALDKRVFGNNEKGKGNAKKVSPVVEYWAAGLICDKRKLSSTKILSMLADMCKEEGHYLPSLSWLKIFSREVLKNPESYLSRHGNKELKKNKPFASMMHAEYSMHQVQLDGWTLPFWYTEHGALKRLVLVYLIDSCSKMIIGYAVGKSENSALIFEAMRDGLNATQQLPFEIVTDNHSLNKTMEAKNLKATFKKRGTHFTVTENPQYKSIIERYNQNLDRLCRDYTGYLGQGIRSKCIDALPSEEAMEQYAKYPLEETEIKAIAISIVEKYNTSVNNKTELSPKQLFEEKKNPHCINATMFDLAHLLNFEVEKEVRRGQITFERSGIKHEFQLDSDQYLKYNNSTVIVKYEDLRDCIYIYDKATGEHIDCLHPKRKINGAIANQTDNDTQLLYQQSGLNKGIMNKAKKQLNDLRDRALEIDPDAHNRLSKMATPKDVLQEMAENASLAQVARAKGIDPDRIPASRKPKFSIPSALMPEKKKTNPFSSRDNKIEVVNKNNDQNSEE